MKFIYIISPDCLMDQVILEKLDQILGAFSSYIYAFQLRIKNKNEAKKCVTASFDICKKHKVNFIVNDFVDIAHSVDADGVHIGIDDKLPTKHNDWLKDKIVGLSCYNSVERALSFKNLTYASFGCFYKSQTKPKPLAFADKGILKLWKKHEANAKNIKCVAIGGITCANFLPLLRYGADIIAVSSFIWGAQNPFLVVENFVEIARHSYQGFCQKN